MEFPKSLIWCCSSVFKIRTPISTPSSVNKWQTWPKVRVSQSLPYSQPTLGIQPYIPWQDIPAWLSLHCLCGCLCWISVSETWFLEGFLLFHALPFAGMGKKDDPKLMQEWFKLVQEKNALVRYESELMILWVYCHPFPLQAFELSCSWTRESGHLSTKCICSVMENVKC